MKSQESPETVEMNTGSQRLISPRGKLLVVDDDENNRDMLSRRLIRQGYAVEVAEGGAEAMEKIVAATYDLILLDQTMPGMTGLDLLRLLRATYSPSDLPVIMVTAVDQSETVVEALTGGANDYVVKPVDMPVMTARIDAQLSRCRSERRLRENEDRLELAVRGGSDGMWDLNLITGEAHMGAPWLTILGYVTDEIEPNLDSCLALIHSEDVTRVAAELESAVENRTPEFHSEFRLRTKAGKYRWTLARGSVLRDAAGKPLRVAGSFTDLEQQKFSDSLTGLGNRPMFLAALANANQPFALLLLDLDGFKLVNDLYGALTGDQVLVEVGRRIQKAVACFCFADVAISRIGEDEFGVLLTDNPSTGQTAAFSDELLAQIRVPISIDGFEITTGACVGIVIGAPCNHTPEQLFRDAEVAMYEAKDLGKNVSRFFSPSMRERALKRVELIHDLRHVIEAGQLAVFYQSKVSLKTMRIVGFEALLRWNHPEHGMIHPLQFIPLAEESGLIISIGEWILREAARQLVQWQGISPPDSHLSMNVNLSVKQLADPDLLKRIQSILCDTGIAPQTLKLELTESALMTNIDSAKDVLLALQGMGIGLKLDDFGTGYSSLSYLQTLHFDSLKIDRSFVTKLTEDAEAHAIVDTIIKLAHTLGMTVVAEGIEEQRQLDELVKLGCDVGQGFYFSRPVDAAAAEQLWMQDRQKT